MTHKRIVIDTGILLSATVWHGVPAKAVEKARDEGTLIFSDATMAELTRVLAYEKFDAYMSIETRRDVIRQFARSAEFVAVLDPIRECEDPNDDIILEAAFYGNADCVIASDKKIAKMHPFRGIPIFSPAQFVEA